MDQSFRLPLVQGLEPRDNTLDKDELSSNIFYDKGSKDHTYAVKRPGLETLIGALGRPAGYYDFQGNPDYYVPWEGTFGSFVYDGNWFGLLPPPPYEWIGKYLNGKFVAVGFNRFSGFEEYIVAESLDGVTWEYKSSIDVSGDGLNVYPLDIVYIDGQYVLYTFSLNVSNTRIRSSVDLVSWTIETDDFFYFTPIPTVQPPANGLLYKPLGSSVGQYWMGYSSDGISWSYGDTYDIIRIWGVTDTEVRTFNGEDPSGTVSYNRSTNGTTYSVVSDTGTFTEIDSTQPFHQAFLVNGIWCVCFNDYLVTSTDFLHWDNLYIPGLVEIKSIVSWDGENYLVAIRGGRGYLKSQDLVNWQAASFSLSEAPYSVNSQIVSDGNGTTVIFPVNGTAAQRELKATLSSNQVFYSLGFKSNGDLWNGCYSLESSLNWLDNGLPTYFNPLPNQETI